MQPHEVLLDAQVHDLSLRGATPLKIYNNVSRRVSIRLGDDMPVITVLDPDPSDPLRDEAVINSAGLAYCVVPDRPHNVGDAWSARMGIAEIRWEVRPAVRRDDVARAVYHYVVPLNGTFSGLDVDQELRLDDGFAGTCIVDQMHRSEDGVERREGATITSTRIR